MEITCHHAIFIIVLLFNFRLACAEEFPIDDNGYLFFCLCMGRFGNQAEHFLGGLSFAKKINRTLILPPFRTNTNVGYDEWFDPTPLERFHRVILAKDFMTHVAPHVWPPEKRFGFCYQLPGREPCQIKIGNPFTNFWDELGIDFVDIVQYNFSYQYVNAWTKQLTPAAYPVIAMRGAPAAFPMNGMDLPIQEYIGFSDGLMDEVEELIKKHFGGNRDYVGVHLRNAVDWPRACEHVSQVGNSRFMASYQCVGFDYKKPLTQDMCLPPEDEVIRKVSEVVKVENARYLFVATDKNPMISQFKAALPDVKIIHIDPWLPVVDAALLVESKHFIGNCVSSFSAFVWRQRLAHAKGPSSHFSFDD